MTVPDQSQVTYGPQHNAEDPLGFAGGGWNVYRYHGVAPKVTSSSVQQRSHLVDHSTRLITSWWAR